MVFLDANLVIYLIEQPANFGPKVTARVTALLAVASASRSATWYVWSARWVP